MAKPACAVGLGIHVDQQHAFADGTEAGGEVHRRRGFTDPSLLVGYGDDPRHCAIKGKG